LRRSFIPVIQPGATDVVDTAGGGLRRGEAKGVATISESALGSARLPVGEASGEGIGVTLVFRFWLQTAFPRAGLAV